MKTQSALALALSAVIFAAAPAAAAPANALAAMQRVPADILTIGWARTASPGPGGLVGKNVAEWLTVGQQRGSMLPIIAGAVAGDSDAVARNWPVIDTSMAHENPDGSFQHAPVILGVVQLPVYEPTSNAFWIAESVEALLYLRQSALGPQYAARIDALVPKYRLALQWLTRPENVAAMIKADGGGSTNRIIEDAKALLLGYQFTGVPAAQTVGEDFLGRGLAAQTPDGYFPERGGPDTSYNATSCGHLAEISLWVDDPRIGPAVARGIAWELAQLQADGSVDASQNTRTAGQETYFGHVKRVNYLDVTRAFALWGAISGDTNATNAARQTAAIAKGPKKPAQ
jgi:hypothetical protein